MRERRFRTVLALAATLAAVLTGCGDAGSSATDVPGSAAGPGPDGSFALALGIDVDDPDAVAALAGYDLVVLDGQGTSAATIAQLQDGGTSVLAYLSAGTVEPNRPWFATARDEGWLLDHWDDWDEWYAEVSAPGLRTLLVAEARKELAKGFDGLFLDNTDMVQTHPDQADGMVALVAQLDEETGPDRLLFAQNGDPVEAGIVDHLDGWNREDVSFTYDFDDEAYIPVSAADHRDALRQLRALRAAGLQVTATDYLPASSPDDEAAAAEAACGAGATPFASDIELTRIPDPPITCAATGS